MIAVERIARRATGGLRARAPHLAEDILSAAVLGILEAPDAPNPNRAAWCAAVDFLRKEHRLDYPSVSLAAAVPYELEPWETADAGIDGGWASPEALILLRERLNEDEVGLARHRKDLDAERARRYRARKAAREVAA
jgi:hypothetical protein